MPCSELLFVAYLRLNTNIDFIFQSKNDLALGDNRFYVKVLFVTIKVTTEKKMNNSFDSLAQGIYS